MVKEGTQRKEVHLTPKVIAALQKQADKDGRTLKNYLEKILIEHAGKSYRKS